MSKILVKGNLWRSVRTVRAGSCRRNYSGDKGEKEKDEEEGPTPTRGGRVVRDKQQSLQEESFFHKEEREQLRELKKKLEDKKKKKE